VPSTHEPRASIVQASVYMWASSVTTRPQAMLMQHHKQRIVCCHAVLPASSAYDWELLATPRLEEGGRFFVAEERIRSFEVGPNQQSDMVAVANMMQVSFTLLLFGLASCTGCWLCVFAHAVFQLVTSHASMLPKQRINGIETEKALQLFLLYSYALVMHPPILYMSIPTTECPDESIGAAGCTVQPTRTVIATNS
jgi:hypothetical protein